MTVVGDKVAIAGPNEVYVINPASGSVLHTLRPSTMDSRFGEAVRTADSLVMIAGTVEQLADSRREAFYFFDPVTGDLEHRFELQSVFGSSVLYSPAFAVAIGQELVVPSVILNPNNGAYQNSLSIFDIPTGTLQRSFFNTTDTLTIAVTKQGWLFGSPGQRPPGTPFENPDNYTGYAALHQPQTGAILQTIAPPPRSLRRNYSGTPCLATATMCSFRRMHPATCSCTAGRTSSSSKPSQILTATSTRILAAILRSLTIGS